MARYHIVNDVIPVRETGMTSSFFWIPASRAGMTPLLGSLSYKY
ncbi:hypothetical protein [Wolbachia endosymbiont (group A) of Ophion ellenae]